jgi:hypothetical protein
VPLADTQTDTELTEPQRDAVAAVLAADARWLNETNLLALLGLPLEREALRAWLAVGLRQA